MSYAPLRNLRLSMTDLVSETHRERQQRNHFTLAKALVAGTKEDLN